MDMTADVLEEAPRYKLGMIHDHRPPEVPDLAAFVTDNPVPAPPPSVAPPAVQWPMALNDQEGDCTIAGDVHRDQAGCAIVGMPWTYPGDAAVHTAYRSLTPQGQDTGLLLSTVLRVGRKPGLFGVRNGGYAVIHPKNTTLVKQGIWIFGSDYIGVNLPMPAQGQFKSDGSGVWELTHTSEDYNIEGGHCVLPVGYTAEGVIAVTWGGTVLITWEWWMTYVTQVYAVVPPAFVSHGGDGRGFNLAALDSWLPRI